jgi:hypothetical protein
MPTCECCKEKSDAVQSRSLRPIDVTGKRTAGGFSGLLCDKCDAKARMFGTPQHLWLLTRLQAQPLGSSSGR